MIVQFKLKKQLFMVETESMKSPDPEITPGLNRSLTLLMTECDIDDASLSRETGIPASTISRMRLNSDANPTASTLRPIAKFFSVSISQLLGDEPLPKERLPGTHNPTYFTAVRMPVISWDLIVDWIDNEGANIKGKLTKWISTEKEIGYNSFALPISTDSFGLAFRKGSMIIVDPERNPLDGDLVLLKAHGDNDIFLKQFLVDGTDIYIRSVNPEMKGMELLSDQYKIIGVIIETRFSLQESTINKYQEEKESSFVFNGVLSSKKI